jgi:hypothetical protein
MHVIVAKDHVQFVNLKQILRRIYIEFNTQRLLHIWASTSNIAKIFTVIWYHG